MKKILLVLFAIWIILPATLTEAATIPSLLVINSNIKLEHQSQDPYPDGVTKYNVYEYYCKDGNAKNYARQYVEMLTSKYPFKMIGHRVSENGGEEYQLLYTGNEKVLLIDWGKDNHGKPYYYHVAVGVYTNKSVDVELARGLDIYNAVATVPKTTPARTNTNTGSDVPDFGTASGIYGKNEPKSGYTLFTYETSLSADNVNNYAANYINLLTSKYNFRQENHSSKTTMNGHCQVDEWHFVYTGNKQITGSTSQGYHLQLKRRRFNSSARIFANKTFFDIEVAQNLNYGNLTVRPATRSGGQDPCAACNATGKCRSCGGSGFKYEWNGVTGTNDYVQCGSCLSSGKCNQCDGRGYF